MLKPSHFSFKKTRRTLFPSFHIKLENIWQLGIFLQSKFDMETFSLPFSGHNILKHFEHTSCFFHKLTIIQFNDYKTKTLWLTSFSCGLLVSFFSLTSLYVDEAVSLVTLPTSSSVFGFLRPVSILAVIFFFTCLVDLTLSLADGFTFSDFSGESLVGGEWGMLDFCLWWGWWWVSSSFVNETKMMFHFLIWY